MSEQQRPKIGVGAYVCCQGKLLVYYRTNANSGGTWSPPGGHLEFGEHWFDCAVRETLEEVGIKAHSPQLFAVTNNVKPESGKHYVTLHVALKSDNFDFANGELDKHRDLQWMDWDDVPTPRMPEMQAVYDLGLKPPYLDEEALAHAA